MSDAASFDAIMQCNLLEVFCEALGAAIVVTDKLDEVSFASVRLLHFFPIPESAIAPGSRARDLYGALFDAGCRLGISGGRHDRKREDWIGERVASAWKERADTIEQSGADRWFRIVSRRFASGLGLIVIQDVSEHKKKELHWRTDQERVRMTEEILDALPVAVAVKDSNLNFAAVNQQFCRMLKTPRDTVLGRGVWDIFEPGLAASLEQADWHLLATGEDRRSVVAVEGATGQSSRLLHRARRVGRPGNHYIAMSFDEIPLGDEASTQVLAPADLTLRVGGADKIVATEGDGAALVASGCKREKSRKVVYIDVAGNAGDCLVDEAAAHAIELCIIHNEAEFSAFLPAIHSAGIALDLVMIGPGAGSAFAAHSARHDLTHRSLPAGAHILDGILDALGRRSPMIQPAPKMPATIAPRQAVGTISEGLDILAIEDNMVNRLVLEQIFESLGLNFVIVANGRDAIGKIAETCPKIVFADVALPDMAACDLIPALEPLIRQGGAKPPVIGLITAECADLREIASKAGFVDTIAKPLCPDAVDAMIRKHLFHEPTHGDRDAKAAA